MKLKFDFTFRRWVSVVGHQQSHRNNYFTETIIFLCTFWGAFCLFVYFGGVFGEAREGSQYFAFFVPVLSLCFYVFSVSDSDSNLYHLFSDCYDWMDGRVCEKVFILLLLYL